MKATHLPEDIRTPRSAAVLIGGAAALISFTRGISADEALTRTASIYAKQAEDVHKDPERYEGVLTASERSQWQTVGSVALDILHGTVYQRDVGVVRDFALAVATADY